MAMIGNDFWPPARPPFAHVEAVKNVDGVEAAWQFDLAIVGTPTLADVAGLQVRNAADDDWLSPASVVGVAGSELTVTYAEVTTGLGWQAVAPSTTDIAFDLPGDDETVLASGQSGVVEDV